MSTVGSSLPTNATSTTGASSAGTNSDPLGSITSDDFLQMMIAELQNQDPMNPMDDSELLQQISQIRDIEAQTDLTTTLGNMSVGQNLASASALISKNVTALDSNGNNITGVVQSVSIQNGEPQLVINGSNVSLSNIQSIQPDSSTTTTQATQDADADTLLQNIQNLLTNGVQTQDQNADTSLSNIQQILGAAAGIPSTSGTGDSSTGDGGTSSTTGGSSTTGS